MKYLHYVDSAVKFLVRNGLEDLPERIDVSLISEIATGTCAPPPNVLRDQNDLPPSTPLVPSPLSFSLLSAHEGSLADQIAPDQSRWADWTDGLNMLRRDSGHVSSKETAGFVQALTEIGLKIKLLGRSFSIVPACTCHIDIAVDNRSIRGNGRDTQWACGRTATHKHGLFLLRIDVNFECFDILFRTKVGLLRGLRNTKQPG